MPSHRSSKFLEDVTNKPTRLEIIKNLSLEWSGAKSICTCGDLGDGPQNTTPHGGYSGHGSCCRADCRCRKFTWKSFTSEFQAAIHSALRDHGYAIPE